MADRTDSKQLEKQRCVAVDAVSCRCAGPVTVDCLLVSLHSCCCDVLSKSALKAQPAEMGASHCARPDA